MTRFEKAIHYAGLILLAACTADTPTAPAARDADAEPAARVIPTYGADGKSADVVVDHKGGWFELGTHAIYFPENSICDPALTAYGPSEWDKPCTTITRPIQIHAEIREADGRPYIVFTPELRFAPVPDRKKRKHGNYEGVTLFFWLGDKQPVSEDDLHILWVPHEGATPVDEALADHSLKTKTTDNNLVAYRRIKHFSGYVVAVYRDTRSGEDEEY